MKRLFIFFITSIFLLVGCQISGSRISETATPSFVSPVSPLQVARCSPPPAPTTAPLPTPLPCEIQYPPPTFTPTPTILPTIAPTVTATDTPVPTAIPTATATPLSPEEEIARLTQAREDRNATRLMNIRVLDYLYRHPDSSARQQLLETAFPRAMSPHFTGVFTELWMQEIIVPQFEATGGEMPQDFETFWQDYGEIIPTDLNADGDTDYLLSVNFLLGGINSNYGMFFWLHFKNEQGILERLSQFDDNWNGFLYPRNISIQNLVGDDLPEITFTVGDCGASTCFSSLRILSLDDGHFTNIFTVPWQTMNGTWMVDRDELGQVVAVGTYSGPGIAGFGDFLSYALHFQYRDDKFMLVEQEPINNFRRPFLYWQLGSLKLHQYQFDEALAIFKDLAADEPPSYGINYPAYAMFRVGMIYLVLEQPDETRKVWAKLIEKYPHEPVSADAYSMLRYWHGDLTIGEVCRFLPDMGKDWGTSEEAYATPAFERGAYLKAGDVCGDIFLLPLHAWKTPDTIAEQMSNLGLQWQFLSDEFDFNSDGVADIAGVTVHPGDEGRSPWVFLSEKDGYQPVLVQNPFPMGSIYIWQREMYDSMYTPFLFDVDVRLKDFNSDGVPEFYAGRYGTYHWVGDGFQPSENDATVDFQSAKLNRAIELLFLNRDPVNALNILDNYNPPFGDEVQMKMLLQGLAWQYLGDQKQADEFFQKFVASYPASGWISFANEIKDRETLP